MTQMTSSFPRMSISPVLYLGPAVVAIGLLLVYLALCPLSKGHNAPKLPSGPPGDPIIGHVRIMPFEYAWKTFAAWGRKYGDVIYVHIFGTPMVIINSVHSARELMDKRGANYSDRPRLVMLSELMGWDAFLTFLPYGDRFRKYRRLMQQHFNSQAVHAFRPLQLTGTHVFLNDLLKTPSDFEHHVHRFTASTMMTLTYGHEVYSDEDPHVAMVERSIALTVEAGSPGGTLVDLLPPLRHIPTWMPGAGFKRHAFKVRALVREMLDLPFEEVQETMKAGTAQPSFVYHMIEEYEKENRVDLEHVEDMKALGAGMYGAGTETTQSILMIFLLAMVLHPEAARRAQEEIDRWVGQNRLPDFSDRDSLPYIDCIMKETLRWNPPVPLGIPHRATKSDEYLGRHIPAGSTIIPNIWHMMRDEQLYSNPSAFDPERFLQKPGQPELCDPRSVVFGFGRRICPGRFFADAGLWLTIASVLAAFDILPPVDKFGREILPEAKFTTGFTSQPKPFDCRIVPRSAKSASLIRQLSAAHS